MHWNSDLLAGTGFSGLVATSPVIGTNGRVYIGTTIQDAGQLQAIEPGQFQRAWAYSVRPIRAIYGSPAIGSDGTIYFGVAQATGSDGALIGIFDIGNSATQRLEVPISNASVTTTPTIGTDGTIYFGASDNNFYAVDPAGSGRVKWRLNLPASFNPGSAAAIGPDGTIYVGNWRITLPGGGSTTNFFAIRDQGTQGVIKWGLALNESIDSSASISKDGTIYIPTRTSLYAIRDNGNSGSLKWNTPFTPEGVSLIQSSPSIGVDGTIYFGVRSGINARLYAIRDLTNSAAHKWPLQRFFQADGDISGSPAISLDGVVHFGTRQNSLYAIRDIGADAVLAWPPFNPGTFTTDGMRLSSPVLATYKFTVDTTVVTHSSVIIGSEDGNLWAVTTTSGLATNAPWPMYRQNPLHTGRVPNQAPTIKSGLTTDPVTPEDNFITGLAFTVGDFETAADALVVTASGSDSVLLPPGSLPISGSGSNRFLGIFPATNRFGAATITVTVTDGSGLSASVSHTLTVLPVNDAPTLNGLGDRQTSEDQPLLIQFSVDDPDRDPALITVTASSDAPELFPNPIQISPVPNSGFRLRQFTLLPATNRTGTARITVTANDTDPVSPKSTSTTFTVTVLPVTDAPQISIASTHTIDEDQRANVPFTIIDVDTPAPLLLATPFSLSPGLVPNDPQHLQITGSGTPNRVLVVTPLANVSGDVIIRVAVEDDATNTAIHQLTLRINPVNDPPTISDIAPQQTVEGQPVQLNFFVNDIESISESLIVSAVSTNTTLVPQFGLRIDGGGPIRLLTITPAAGQRGETFIRLNVSDGLATATTQFRLRVGSTNDAPTIQLGSRPVIFEDTTLSTPPPSIPFTVADTETPPGDLQVTVSSLDPSVVPNSPNNLILGGIGAERSLFIVPAPNQYADFVRLTLTVSDGTASTVTNFNIRVQGVNDAPTATPLFIDTEENKAAVLTLAGFDIDNAINELRFQVFQAKNPPSSLITNGLPLLTYVPINGFAGIDTFYYQVTDPAGDKSALTKVTVSVRQVNDPPSIANIPNQITQVGVPLTVPVAIFDPELQPVLLSARSENELVLPSANVVFGGIGTNRTATLTPAPGRSGQTRITITATDSGGLAASVVFELRVNAPPAISPIADQSATNGFPTAQISFVVSDPNHQPSEVFVTAQSLDQELIPNGAIFLSGGEGLSRSVVLFPSAVKTGTTRIVLTALDPLGGSATNSFQVTVFPRPQPPVITTQPTSKDVLAGTPASFIVHANGTEPLTYQWYFNGSVLPGATSLSLNLTSTTPAQAGSYFVKVENPFGVVTSSTATLTVTSPLRIVDQPVSRTNVVGTTASFSVTATGDGPITYQWLHNTIPILGSISSTLEIPNVQLGDSGIYSVRVSNLTTNRISSSAFLIVIAPPSFTLQPTNQTIAPGSNVRLVSSADGTQPLAYQWLFNGTALPGATNATLTLNNILPAQGGIYSVVATNVAGTAASQPATITILGPPVITLHPAHQAVIQGRTTLLTVQATGSEPLVYRWTFFGTNLPDANSQSLLLTNIQSNQAGPYAAVVTNAAGSVTSSVATVTVLRPPQIVRQPSNQSVFIGEAVTLSVQAAGSEPLHYQWRFQGNPIPGANTNSYAIAQATTNHQGGYLVVITNLAGTVSSDVAQLTVESRNSAPLILTHPANTIVEVGATATFSVTVNGAPTPTLLWYFQATNLIQSGLETSLVMTNVQPEQEGFYHVIATNIAGTATSSNALLSVTFPNQPPVVAIQRPINGASFSAPATLSIDASATDADGLVIKVEFLLDGAKVGEDSSAPYNFTIPGLGVGSYLIAARATDNIDAATTSAEITVTVSVQNNLPALSINDASTDDGGVEGSAPPEFKPFAFSVNLSPVSSQTVSVEFATADDTAKAGSDYLATNGVIHFAPGQSTSNVTVLVRSDLAPDSSFESFFVNLSNPQNAALADDQGYAEIIDDEIPVYLRIQDAPAIFEGNSGRNELAFEVRLTEASPQEVRVDFTTADGTARAVLDYVPRAGTIIFPPNTEVQTIRIPVIGDSLIESNETLFVRLANPVNASLAPEVEGGQADAEGIGTIQDDDAAIPVNISIDPVAPFAEGSSGERPLPFTVRLSAPTRLEVKVEYTTADRSALAGKDYLAIAGTLTFAPGVTNQIINVPIKGNLLDEPDREFLVRISNPVGGSIVQAESTALIRDDDLAPSWSVTAAVPRPEGNPNTTTTALFTLRLSTASSQVVRVHFTTEDGTASATAGDYVATSGDIELTPGSTTTNVPVIIRGDGIDEPTETFFLILSDPQNSTVGSGRAQGTILDDDVAPSLSIAGASVLEGNSGQTNVIFKIRLSASTSLPVTVAYETVAETAAAGSDYQTTSGVLTLDPGATENQIVVPVFGDATLEPDETFLVRLSNSANATLPAAGAQAQALILNDDAAIQGPAIVDHPDSLEIVAGSSAVFTVIASGTPPLAYQWRFNGAALAGATNSTFSRLAAQAAEAGSYDVVVTNAAGSVTSQTAILTVLIPPTFVLHPAPRSVLAGTPTTFFAIVNGSQPLSFQWRLNGQPLLGASSNVFTLPAVKTSDAGDYTLIATNKAGAASSNPAKLTVLTPTNQPPSVRIASPANGSAFPAPSTIAIQALASDTDGAVQGVEFFIGTTSLGVDTTAPYEVSWTNTAVGSYSLTAKATDDKGESSVSAPVNVLFTRAAATAVAIVRNESSQEITEIQDYLLELGLSSTVFDQSGLTYDQLSEFQLIIWDDTGATGLTANDADVFKRLRDNDYPLYFIGERIASSGAALAEPQRTLWSQITRLANAPGGSSSSLVTIAGATAHPVINGRFGTVGNLNYPQAIESARAANQGEIPLGAAGAATALLAFESGDGRHRAVSQNVLASVGADPPTIIEQKKLFKNAVVWLSRKSFPALTDLSLAVTGPVDPVQVGADATVVWRIRQRGEVEASGVNLVIAVPSGLAFVGADFTQGTLKFVNGVLTYTVGNMENGAIAEIRIKLRPTTPGVIRISGTVNSNEADPNLLNNTASWTLTAQGSGGITPARLAVVGFGATGFQGQLFGQQGQRYRIEYSTQPGSSSWTTLTEVTAQTGGVIFTDPAATGASARYYRAVPVGN